MEDASDRVSPAGDPVLAANEWTAFLQPGFTSPALGDGYDKKVTQATMYGNFDIILDQFSRISQLRPTQHALCAVLYLVTMLIAG